MKPSLLQAASYKLGILHMVVLKLGFINILYEFPEDPNNSLFTINIHRSL